MPIEQAEFGRTGHQSSRVIFGAAALAQVSQRVADETLDVLLAYGVNHLDVASSYGEAEVRIRPWLHREPAGSSWPPRATSAPQRGRGRNCTGPWTDGRRPRRPVAAARPRRSDRVGQALSPGGALEAALEAREQGLVRAIGVTGHGSQIAATHRRSLERFDFDSVLLPYNFMQNPYYAENFDALHETCRERRIAVQTIKSIALRPWAAGRIPGRPGTSRLRSRTTSILPCGGRWAALGCS